MAFGWIAPTSALASVVRKLKTRCSPSIGLVFVPRTPAHCRQMPANAANGLSSAKANHVGVFFGLVSSYSQNDVNQTGSGIRLSASRANKGSWYFERS